MEAPRQPLQVGAPFGRQEEATVAADAIPLTDPDLDKPVHANAKESRSSSPGPDYTAARAFARIGWPKVWARLSLYATGTLRFAAIDAESAGVVEAADLVSTLLVTSLDGMLGWTLPEDATEEQILGLACAKLHGMRRTLQRQAARTGHYDDALDERPDPGPDALARLMRERGIVDMERLFEHDAEASVYLGEMLEGEARAEIMCKLGWPLRRANTAYKRIVRGIAAHARRINDDSEDAPPSSGP
jgi:hypothetical protein